MANHGLWRKELQACRFKFLASVLVLAVTAAVLPLMHDYTVRLMETSPVPEFARNQLLVMKDFRFWVWSQWFNKNLVQMGSIIAVIFGAGLISAEMSNKTMHFLLAKPLRREDVFTVKYLANFVNLILVAAVSGAALYLTIVASGQSYPPVQFMEQMIVCVAGLAVVFSMAVYFSTVFDQTLKAAVVTGVAALVLSIPGYFPGLVNYSLYYQMSGYTIFTGHGFPILPMLILVVSSLILHFLGRKRFAQRDL